MKKLVSIGQSPKDAKSIPIHSHPNWEVIYFFDGVGILNIGDSEKKCISFKPGDIVCMPPNIPHHEASQSGFQSIYFTIEVFEYSSELPIIFRDTEDRDFYTILMLMLKEFYLDYENKIYLIESLLNVLHNFISAWNCQPAKNIYVEQFKKMVIANLGNCSFKVNSAINSLHISPDYFRKLFKKETGISPNDYLINKRIEYAKHLLSTRYYNNATIKYIASQVGYIDQYHFSKVFKKHTGNSPKIWIDKHFDKDKL